MTDQGDIVTTTISRQRRRGCGITFDKALQIFSSLLIPLLLSVFTIVIAVYQQKVANDNRVADSAIVREQKRQDQNASEAQRNFDRILRDLQRKTDQQALKLQREQDRNISILQRETDSISNTAQRKQKLNLTETNFFVNQQQKQQDLMVADNIKQEQILGTYIQEASSLVWPLNMTIYIERIHAIRWKTMTALRQFDGKRKAFVLKYLVETGLIFNENPSNELNTNSPLDLKWSNFDGIDLRQDGITSKFNFTSLLCASSTKTISLRKVRLSNGIFDNIIINYVDFKESIVKNTSFKNTNMIQVSFIKAKLINSNFEGATLKECDFTQANLTGSTLTEQQLYEAFIDQTIMPDGKTLLYDNLLKQYFIDPIYQNWTEETNFEKLWKINHQLSNNSNIIKQSYNYLKQFRYDIHTTQNISITRQVNTPLKYKNWIENQQAWIIASVHCGWNSNRSLLHQSSINAGTIYAFIQQYDQFSNIIKNITLGEINHRFIEGDDSGSFSETLNVESWYHPQSQYFTFVINFQYFNSNPTEELIRFCENPQVRIVRRAIELL